VLDLCIISDIPTFEILKLMPKVMKGRHGNCNHVRMERAKEIRITTDTPVAVHSDGEILATDAVELSVKVEPKALQVITGREL
jgi:diacylglycerol kinase family enzyme